MRFKMDLDLKRITSPILLKVGNKEYRYENGKDLSNQEFDMK